MAHRNLFIVFNTGYYRNYVRTFKSSSHFCVRQKHYDIAIAGGGMVGTAMACALAHKQRLSDTQVLLLEGSPHKKIPKKSTDDEYSNRVVSINPGTRQFFESLGVWEYIKDVRFKTVKKMQVWDACSHALITFNDDLVDDVSYIIENDVIMYAIEQALQKSKNNVTIEYDSKIKDIHLPKSSKQVKLVMEDSREYTCNLLIGADGANSQTRKVMGDDYLSWDYGQMGIVATLQLSEPTENVVAWQRFLPSGPVALLPLTDDLSSLVWSTTNEQARQLLQLSDESFVDAVNDAFWKVYDKNEIVSCASQTLNKLLETVTQTSNAVRQLPPSIKAVAPKSRAAFPLGFGHAMQYVAPGVALIGDAAHRVHPLAGQGVNLGFGDVQCLAEILSEAVFSGVPLGSFTLLADYESKRLRHNFPTMLAIDCLQKLYGTSFTPIVLLRSLGLQVTQSLNPLKKAIMQHASS